MTEYHTCVRTSPDNDNRHLTSKIVSEYILEHVRNGPLFAVKEIQTLMKNKFDVDISYKKAWFARRNAIDVVYGDWPTSIAQLPKYMKELQAMNPGTAIFWRHHSQSNTGTYIFGYVFWSFGPVIEAFRHMRPVICVDGTHMRGPYKSKLLTAIGINADNRYLPLAFALVDEENNESWSWFMTQLRVHVCPNIFGICVISDRHKGIINAMNNLEYWKEPAAYHRFCLLHVRANMTKKFKSHM